MEINSLTSLATSFAKASTDQDVGIAVLNKALDSEVSTAAALIAAIPVMPSANLPAHLGSRINVVA